MKKRILRAWLVIFIAALFVTGCGGGTEKVEVSKDKVKVTDGDSTVEVTGGEEEKRLSTPEDTFHAFQDAVKNGEFEKMYDFVSSKEQKQMDAQVAQVKKTISAHLNKPADKEKLKKLGITDEKIKNMTGRDVMRVSLVMGQIMAEMFTPKGKPVPDTIKEMKDEIGKAKLLSSKINADGKTAALTVQNAKGKTEVSKMVLENGQWKLEEDEKKKSK